MGKNVNNQSDPVARVIYAPHLEGGATNPRNNPNIARSMVLENMYRRILTELCANRFTWHGLPTTVDVRFIELTLFRSGCVVFYFEEEFDRFLAVRGSGSKKTNMYENPTGFNIYGTGLPRRSLSSTDCVPIYSNYMRVPDLDVVEIYSSKLADIDRSIEINAHNLRKPKILVSSDDTQLSMQQINRQLDEGQSAVAVTGAWDPASISALDLGVDAGSLSALLEARAKIWGECMTLLGINNAVQDKKERVQSAEIEANEDQVSAQRAVNLNARREACARINELFYKKGDPKMLQTPVTVDFNLSPVSLGASGIGVA